MGDPGDPTVIERKRGATPASAPGASGDGEATSSATHASTRRYTYATPAETLRADEMLRTRVFLRVVMLLLGTTVFILPVLGGDRAFKLVLVAAMVLTFAVCGGFLLYIRNEDNYTPERAIAPALITVVAAMAACNYFGLFSPAPMLLVFGVGFVSQSASLGLAGGIYVTVVGLHAAGSLLLAAGVLPDRGIVRVESVPELDRYVIIAAEQLVFLTTFLLARLSRRATLTAMERLEHAIRQVGQREALLQEANRDLERALKGGYRGRWSAERVGPWQLGEVIGRGAMGEVYQAQHAQKGTPAAVKLLAAHAQREPDHLRRFLREAEVMSRVDSPHVVKVHDVGLGADGPPYIAMELLEGHDLAWYLRRKRRLSPERVCELVDQVASALEQARRAQIVHRDLKPQNLFHAETHDGAVWKVLDFGVSKLGPQAGTLTRGHVVGTPGYMSPEQARGLDADHRADVFSLAVIAYRALTGRPAFSGDEYPKIMFDLVYVQPSRPTEHVPLPIDVDFVLGLGLAKAAADRFDTALAFAEALRQALRAELPPEVGRRAQALLLRQPWGEKIE
jgi:serine/threonine-protein kinase